ncbi:MAG: hypothetical protein K0R28_6016 [Paenibacillus sp.]|jgi:hypothetical protein|nr:hypothetical protein [Paenibacillus sp.]
MIPNHKYPYVSSTATYSMTYTILYFFTFMLAGASYSMIMNIPADQSRATSWLYYGILFVVIPNVGIGLLARAYTVGSGKKHAAFIHSLLVTQCIDKLGVPFLATIIAGGFPASWYGRDFPTTGYRLLCEELPFYCTGYVQPYLICNTIAGTAILFMTVYLLRGAIKREV